MRIYQRFTFREDNKKVMDFIDAQNIQLEFKVGGMINAIGIYEDDPKYRFIIDSLANLDLHPSSAHTRYTQQEMDEAEWLTIATRWENGYPQPSPPSNRQKYYTETYDASNFCKCGGGSIQKNSFKVKAAPKWGTGARQRHSLKLYWIHDEIFISQEVKKAFIENNVKGVKYLPVLTGRDNRELECTSQLFIENHLDLGLKLESIDFDESLTPCPECGNGKYLIRAGYLYYDRKVFDKVEVDIIKSGENFGSLYCVKEIFVNQRLRQILIANKLDKSFRFVPVQLV